MPPPRRPPPPLQPAHRSALSIGFLIGVSFMFCQLLLIVCVVSGANLAQMPEEPHSSTKAVTGFASLLLLAEISFTVFVTMFRDTLLPPNSMASTDTALPPPSFGSGPGAYEPSSAGYGDSVHVQPMPMPAPGGGGVL